MQTVNRTEFIFIGLTGFVADKHAFPARKITVSPSQATAQDKQFLKKSLTQLRLDDHFNCTHFKVIMIKLKVNYSFI